MDLFLAIVACILLSFVPAFFFAWIVYWTDRYEKEPILLLGVVFVWGAVVAAGGAFLINTILGVGVLLFTGSEAIADLTTGSLIAPVIEEILKGFAVLVVFLVFRREFDSIMDGIVYASIAALGFSATENAYYIFSYGFAEDGVVGIIALFIIRVILVGWQHPFYTAFTGIGMAVSRLNRHALVKVLAPLVGLGAAMFLHSAHNTLAGLISGLLGLATTVLFDWTGWFAMFIFILWALAREQKLIRHHLNEEVSLGVMTAAQYQVACSAWRQTLTRWGALFSGRHQATRRFFQLTGELAHKKQQRATLGEEGGNTWEIETLRRELTRLSTAVSV